MNLKKYIINGFKQKVKASTIVETLVATVIIIVIFSISSLTLNNIFKSTIKSNTSNIENHISKLIYFHQNGKIVLPYKDSHDNWEIEMNLMEEKDPMNIQVLAKNIKTGKKLNKTFLDGNKN